MVTTYFILSVLFTIVLTESGVNFKEKFPSEADFTNRWTVSTYKGGDQGAFKLSAGKYFNDEAEDKGIQTTQDAKFYGISAKLEKPFSTEGNTLVVQFSVKHEQSIDCGGGYIKILSSDFDQKKFHGETPYKIMFGPDICGYSTKKVHVIFNYNGKNLDCKKEIKCEEDELTHIYTLIVKPDNTYEVLIDNVKKESGSLEEDWDFLEPKKIKDPEAKKPSDWEDKEEIDDPTDKKPDNYDKPKTITDPKAKKPDDWDDEMDGEWEAPKIDNPDYKGEWKPKQIKNPKYKGEWIHPEIDNPSYKPNDKLYIQEDIGAVGFDLWQVKSGSIFDNVLLGTDPEVAKKDAQHIIDTTIKGEKAKKEKADEEQKKKDEEEQKKRDEEEKKKKDEEGANKKTDDKKDESLDEKESKDSSKDTDKDEEHDEL